MSHIPRPPRPGQDPPAAHLKLVHPAPPPPPPKKKLPRHETRLFTTEEQGRLRAALINARGLFGTWDCLADAMHVSDVTIDAAKRNGVSPALAIRLARALGRPLETLLRAPADAAVCPSCGRCGP